MNSGSFHNNAADKDLNMTKAAVVNGEALFSTNSCILPYKSREPKAIVIQEMYFVPSTPIQEDDIVTDKFYSERTDRYFWDYSWEWETTLNTPVDGLLIYSTTLTEGGNKEDRNKEEFRTNAISNGKSHIIIMDFFDDAYFENPRYTYKYYGYVEVRKTGNN